MVRPRIPSTPRLGPVLVVGGFDPSGHAGVLTDARVFESLGIPCQVALTAITAQSEKRFLEWEPVSIPLFRAQLEAAGQRLRGVKLGMLATPAHVLALLAWLKKIHPPFVVWDPVLRSSTGALLFRGQAEHPSLRELWRRSDAVTPNWPEAEWLLGNRIHDAQGAEAAAERLYQKGNIRRRFLVLKGGHANDAKASIDLVRHSGGLTRLRAPRRPGSRRGSGCTFAAALLAGLCQGKDPVAAARFAKREVLRRLFVGFPGN